jgi:o-succinylbenzoate synthase
VIRATRLIEHHHRLSEAAASGAGTWSERRALTLVVEDEAGRLGLGEAAPLPGFSPDSLDPCRTELRALLGSGFPTGTASGGISAELGTASSAIRSAAARMALETALLDVWARQSETPAWALLGGVSAASMPPALNLSLWLPNDAERAVSDARRALERGVRCFKVKVGDLGSGDRGLELLRVLRETFGREVELRADANRQATVSALRGAAGELRALDVAWVEEPTREPLVEDAGVPVALDESLVFGAPDWGRARAAGTVAVVLKPTILGGLARSLDLGRQALASGVVAVTSHTLEGPVAYAAVAALSLGLGSGRPADGLAPHAGLAGIRPPCLAPDGDRLVAWPQPGLGVSLDQALVGRTVTEDLRA